MRTSSLRQGIAWGLALALAPAAASAQTGSTVCVWTLLGASICQADSTPDDPKAAVAELLIRARKAINDGDFEIADALLSRAEAMQVRFGPFHRGDTPKKARRDLERAKKSSRAPAPPSQRSQESDDDRPDPQAASPRPGQNPDDAGGRMDDRLTDPRHQAKAHLLRGRKELSRGNLAAADHWRMMAASLKVQWQPNEDTPERLLADIQAAGGGSSDTAAGATRRPLSSEPAAIDPLLDPELVRDEPLPMAAPGRPDDEQALDPFGRRTVRQLDPDDVAAGDVAPETILAPADGTPQMQLVAARRALAQGDLRRAKAILERLRENPAALDVHDDSPERIAASIARFEQLTAAREGDTPAARRARADWFLEQAQWLLRGDALGEAQAMAQQAAAMGASFGAFDTTPEMVLAEIAQRRQAPAAQPAGPVAPASPVDQADAGSLADDPRQQVALYLAEARQAIRQNDLAAAEHWLSVAQRIGVPDSAYGPRDDRPAWVMMAINEAVRKQQAGGAEPVAATAPGDEPGAMQADYDPSRDATQNVAAAATQAARPAAEGAPSGDGQAEEANSDQPAAGDWPPAGPAEVAAAELFAAGEEALRADDRASALSLFLQADAVRDQLDPITQQVLAEHLVRLRRSGEPQPLPSPTMQALPQVSQEQQVLIRQTQAELAAKLQSAARLAEEEPARALELLKEARQLVEEKGLDPRTEELLLQRVDRKQGEIEQYMLDNRARLELNARNKETLDRIERARKLKEEIDVKLAKLVDEHNQLMDEQRWAEAEVVAKRAKELAPDSRLARQLEWQSKLVRRIKSQSDLTDRKEDAFVRTMQSVDESSIPFDDSQPYRLPDAKVWKDLIARRSKFLSDPRERRHPREIEIENKLKKPVTVQFTNEPLAQVIDTLSKMSGINMHLDATGLAEEGVSSDEPVTFSVNQEISLRSALKVILEDLHLDFVIENEILKITSEQRRSGPMVPHTYSVADLVIPIPNFVPNSQYGLTGMIREGYRNIGYGGTSAPANGMPIAALAANGADATGAIDPKILAQMGPQSSLAGMSGLSGRGPGGLAGGAGADFDSLINLIQTTIEPDIWDDTGVGGPHIEPYETNLSLVISAPQDIHERIADLLAQLRRLQDLQVTVEVRFITVNDNFFERIGIDFDFDLDDSIDRPLMVFGKPIGEPPPGENPVRDFADRDGTKTKNVFVGLEPNGQFRQDLDIPFRQSSFTLAVPQFGGFDPGAGIELGFAIMTELETFFLINAAQGDRRTNVLQAPKVTLFNGQLASVNDTSQTPFVVGVVPVVGDFAAAQQPVIVVLSEGTQLTVQAVVSSDRRFVRLTMLPYFSNIGDVDTFTFTGSTRTTEDSSSAGPESDTNERSQSRTTITEGTTVQLPTLASVSVSTTVSVPDGGTVLLGGIKRLSEGRNEFGVPILNKIPYISRLFKNVGIGRDTQSLMMMVTPRIIIQEEEEDLILGNTQTP